MIVNLGVDFIFNFLNVGFIATTAMENKKHTGIVFDFGSIDKTKIIFKRKGEIRLHGIAIGIEK